MNTYHLLAGGLYIWEGRGMFLSTAHSDADVDRVVEIFADSVRAMLAGGFFEDDAPTPPSGGGGRSPFAAARVGGPASTDAPVAPAVVEAAVARLSAAPVPPATGGGIRFGISFFGHYASGYDAQKYRLLFEAARYADASGFSSLWLPERHFHAFGGLSPNPSVLSAALARETSHIQLRAGSVVLPLHHPVRVAEEWSMVDNLSQGRVGIACASGWHPNDFVFAPEAFGNHRELMFQRIEQIQALWRGEPLRVRDGSTKEIEVKLFPMPRQTELPIWVTIVGNPDTYRRAGEIGAGILTNLMGQTVEALERNLALYRQALVEHGHGVERSRVSVLLHTFVCEDAAEARAVARAPFIHYLRSSVGLFQNMVDSLGLQADVSTLSEDDRDYLLSVAYERYVEHSALIGSPATCRALVERLQAIGVDEIGCFIDFGVDPDTVLGRLDQLALLKQSFEVAAADDDGAAERYPLVPAQKGIWFECQISHEAALSYNTTTVLGLRGALDHAALARALQQVVDRHAALRSVVEADGEHQRVLSAVEIGLPVVDVSREADRDAAIKQWFVDNNHRPMDPGHGPLVRACLLRKGEAEHLLALTFHHVVIDGYSQEIVLQELAACYRAACRGGAPGLPAASPFREQVERHQAYLRSDRYQQDRAYWRGQFASLPPSLELSGRHARPSAPSHRARRHHLTIDGERYARLQQLSRKLGGTLFMTMLASVAVLLQRLSGQAEMVIGVPMVVGRAEGSEASLVGCTLNLVPVRCDGSGDPSFAEFLGRIKRSVLEAHAHADYPFGHLLRDLDLRASQRRPLAPVLFNLNRSLALPQFDALQAWLEQSPISFSPDDLTIDVMQLPDRLQVMFQYQAVLFEHEAIERMAAQFVQLLDGIVADPACSIGRLALLSAAERRQIVDVWNAGEPVPAPSETLHAVFEAQVRRTPEAIAVEHEGRQVTYAELNARANRVAHALRRLGVGPDARVGLCAERSVELVVGLLGILKAGGGYVPLDPSYPQDRLAYMLEDSAPVAVLAQSNTREQLGALSVPVLDLESPLEEAEHDPQVEGLQPHHLAYVIYTSGSTGQPKGVLVEHRQVARLFTSTQPWFGFGAEDVWTLFHSFAFDFSVWELFGALLHGGRLVVVPKLTARSPQAFYSLLCEAGVTVLNQTPSAFRQLMAAQQEAPAARHRLRQVILGGEALEVGALRPWYERAENAGTQLVNMYGITETTVHVSYRALEADDAQGTGSPIGRRIPDLRAYVLDAHGEPVPVGGAGELYIGGAGVARGYLNRPELTAERFVANPFHGEGRERMYRTGDLGRWLPDGSLEYLGRADAQVKLRGFRIELGEIEARLSQCAGVREAVVTVREDAPGEQRLVAYYVSGEAIEAQALREQLQGSLPEYMVPAAYVRLEQLPLTSNGKLDRKGLPAPEGQAYASTAYEAPQGEVEQTLAAIWQTLLGVERVGRHDDFFALGGHSLQAVRLVAQVRTQLGAELGLTELFAQPSLSAVAQAIVRGQGSALPAITAADRSEPLPLSFAQQRLWLLAQMEGGSEAYHIPVGLRLKGELDEPALRRSLDRIVARHEALRTRFEVQEGQAVQRVASADVGFALDRVDLQGQAESEQTLAVLSEREANTPFDLEQGPLIRGCLVTLGEQEHVLLITMHHIVSDGWSQGVLARELGTLYEAYRSGGEDPLPALPIQYADYAVWQRRWLDGAELQRQSTYWEQALAGAPTLLSLPTDRVRPAQQDYAGGSVEVVFDAALSTGLRKLSQRHGTTLFMTMLAGWSALLSRLSGQDEVVVGSPVANRTRSEVEGLIGFFVNTLALRVDVGSATVSELLGRVKASVLEAQAHQDLPFEQVVERVKPVRSLSHSPIFQAVFSWHNTDAVDLSLRALSLESLARENATAKLDIQLELAEVDGRIVGTLNYATALFERSTAQRYADYLLRMLQAMVADDGQQVGRIALLGEAERAQVLQAWNATERAWPAATLPALFEAQVMRTPDAVALKHGDQQVSYRELDARANRLAHHLRELGVAADVLVGLCVDRSIEMIVGLLGILKAGGAYVPLDPDYPQARLAYIFQDAMLSVLVSKRALAQQLPIAWTQVVELDDAEPAWADHPPTPPQVQGEPGQLAYVIYTSGSTGQPKGVAVTHQGVASLVSSQCERFGVSSQSRVLQFASISFDAAVSEIGMGLLSGACLVLAPAQALMPGAALTSLLDRERITHVTLPPAVLALMPEQALPADCHLIVAGEACPAPLVRRWSEGRTMINAYGPTEATVCATMSRALTRQDAPSIGGPIGNVRVYVLDAYLQPVPVGVTGELYLAGSGLARGYWQRAGLTAERFMANPFALGERMYKTGDLARWQPDCSLEYQGRADAQVKLRGFRIELGEIEARLSQCAGVREAVVTVREDAPGEQRLVAYYVSGEAIEAQALREQLQANLPEYMVPAAYVRLEHLPLTPNGKLDRKGLPAPEGQAYASTAYEAPQGEVEQTLAGIWQTLLSVERVGRHDDFFALGGHSLQAVRLVAQVRTQLGAELGLTELFAQPSLSAVAQAIVRGQGSALPAITAADRSEPLPLSFAQQRLWFLAQMEGGSEAYHIPVGLRLKGELDEGALRRSLDRIVARHEALRTRFEVQEGQAVQRVASADVGLALESVDLSTEEAPEHQLSLQAEAEARAPFDLEQGPLIRGRLVKLGEREHVLLITMHHIVSDGWSQGVLARELGSLYEAYRAGNADPLPALPIQYADYAVWQRRWLEGAELQRQGAYWEQALVGAQTLLSLPTDRARPAQQDYAGGSVEVVFDETLSTGLRKLSQRHGTTLFMTVLAGWSALLSRLSGQEEVVVGSPVANRTRSEVEGLIGFFVNTLALRVEVGSATVSELLERVKSRVLEAQAHQDLPFEQVVERVRPVRSLSHSPVFQAALSWLNTEAVGLSLELEGLTIEGVDAGQAAAKFDLTLELRETSEGLAGSLDYATALFDRETIERYLGYLHRLLAAMVENDSQEVNRIALLDEDERAQLLESWNETKAAYPDASTIHGLFEAQVRRTPEAIAVEHEGQQVSYAELNVRANRVAHALRRLGVGPDARVGLCAERSVELVIGLLGILKAGGGYVPLDPSYPQDRLAYMLEDSAPAAVLTQGPVREQLGKLSVPVLDLASPLEGEAEHGPQIEALKPHHLAYVIYTSGSTGRPKGVMNEHSGVVNRLWWAQQTYRLDASDRILQKTPFGFDVSVWELFWPLLAGARLVMARPEGHKDPAYLAATIEQAGITTLHFVPSMLQLFLDQVEAGRCQGLRRILCSGEALPHALQQRGLARFPQSELHNLYGPTEAAIDVTSWRCNAESHPGIVPIGRPIANTQIYVLDVHQQPVPLGVTGEIYIGGVGVARGYLNRPELTAERFVANPFHGEGRERMYRTGDLGRWLPDGSLEYQGRSDAQVKLRGFRIELGEIEARLSQCIGVREAVVTMREDVPGEQRLVAYYVSDEAIEAQVLREQLQTSLPEYMVPAAYVRLERLPLTPNGKLDRKGLPAPDGQAYASSAYEAPQGEVEQTLASIWQTLLGVERVGRHDDFFALGGHSLQAVRLMSLVEQAGWRADVSRLFLQPTLAGFSASITVADAVDIPANRIASGCTRITPSMLPLASLSQAAIDRMAAQVPGGAANIEDIYPLAPLQEGILYHHLMAKQRDPYLLFAMFRMDSRTRLEAFAQGLQSLIARHTILRTAVIWDGLDEPMQVVWRQARLERQPMRLDAADGDIATQLKQRFDQGLHGLDLRQAPLMRLVFAEDAASGGWVAMLVFHHMVDDATSMKWLGTELEACLANEARHLPRAIPFRNYVARTRQAIAGNAHEAFFREMLADVVEPTLPFGLQDVRGGELAIGQATRRLSGPLSRRLRQQARLLKVSAASLHHLAWARVVGATSGRDDVVFGTVLMGRSQGGRGAEHTVGMFINTLPLRVLLDDRMVSAGARDTHVRLAALMGHESAPLAEAQRCSGVAAPQPLFGALLNYRQNMQQPEPAGQVSAAWAGIDVLGMDERTNYPLTAVVDDLGDDFGLIVQTVPGMDAERIVGYLETALASLVASLERGGRESLRSLTVLPESERHQQIEAWNQTEAAYASASTLPGLVEAQAARTQDAIAVEHGASKLSYRELDRQANRLAHRLIAQGVVPDARVGLCVERGLPMVISVLGILKAGGSYVPLDPSYPRDRLAYMLEDSAPVAVVAQSGTRDRLGERPVPMIDLDDEGWQTEPSHRPKVAGLSSHHAAYVIYTSGSTGQPKGVTVEHRQVVNLLESMRGLLAMTEADRWLAVTTLGFDIAGLELYLPLISGAAVVVLDREESRNAQSLSAALENSGATVMQATPSTWRLLLESGWSGRPGLKALCGGEALPGELSRRLRARVGRLWNVYGPTETTIWSSAREVDAADAGQGIVPIGRPIANTQIYVLDVHQQPVPLGVTGEIYIGGAGVARGYLNRPELTAERFVANPFHGEGRERMYRTGDLGRWLPDGSLEYQGRGDAQVKLRGFRIELGEIEARLSQCAGVREAVVAVREDAPGEQRLVAYYVSGEAIEAQALREQLQASLPEYMVPAAYVKLEHLPLTPNGKLDRKVLPAPEDQAYASTAYEAPQGEVEQTLASIWQTLLGVERVGRHDDFFALGGHSLQAVRLVAQVRTQLGAELGLTELFAQPSLSAVAQAIVRGQGSALSAITVADRSEPLPLSFAQQRLWFLAQMEGGSEAYHIPVGLRLKGELDEGALRCALDRIVARHEALRTRFEVQEGQAVQRVAPADVGLTLDCVDLSAEEASEHQLGLLAEAEARAPFDLEQGPLIRGRLVRLDEQENVLLITMHHIVSDGWSQGVLARELGSLYEAYRAGNADPLPALPIQYADYAVWQRRWLEGGELQRQGSYWEQALAGAPTLLSLPTDRARPAQQDYAGGSVEVVFDETLSAGLRRLSQRHGTTLFMTVLAGWSALLSRLSGQDDVVVGSPVANRTRSEVEGLIGFFVNTLALRVEVGGGTTVSDLLERAKAKVLEAQAHQDLPFEQVVERVRPVRSLSHSPVFQAALSWLNTEAVGLSLELEGLTIDAVDAGQSAAKFDLTLELRETSEGLAGSLDYATALFDRETIERYLGYLHRLLTAMVENDSQQVNRIALLDEGERVRLLDSWTETKAPYPQASTIHGLFEAQVRRTPEAIAVEHEGQQVSYAELNARANRVAHALIGLGVGPDARVGLCAERSVELVVGLMGILKAGGGYVPLDPSYPQDRLAYMLEDSAPVAVLKQGPVREQLGKLSVPVLDLASPLESEAEHDPQVDVKPHHLAYVIYTSGSTGRPKGVMIEHRNTVNFLAWAAHAFPPASLARTLFSTSLNFDLSVFECFAPLTTGGCIDIVVNVLALGDGTHDVRLINTVPSALSALLESSGLDPAVEVVNVAGEALKRELVERLFAQTQAQRLYNLYGPSETTTYSSWVCMDRQTGFQAHIGRPIANTQIYVLDVHQQPVPLGVTGEIYIGGAGVARGYLNRPELTAERFVANPFQGEGRERMYKTGDLGRWLPDGSLEYRGRADAQVKLRGFRIELGEIEARLSQCAGVRGAVVTVREDTPGQPKLVAYYVSDEAIEAQALREQLQVSLPEYMVPAAYVRLEHLPLTPNGKLDRKGLPAPEGQAYASTAYEAPQGEVEIALAGIWQTLLNVERVGRHDDFFNLGGHSLQAVRLVTQVRTQLGAELGLTELFAQPSLSAVAQAIVRGQGSALPAITVADRSEALPLSFAQQRLWFLAQMDGGSEAYHIPVGLRLKGELDEEALRRALDRIVARHEALRTRFEVQEGQAVQHVVSADVGLTLDWGDLSAEEASEHQLGLLTEAEARAPFDLEHGPLIRGRLVKLGEQEHVLLITTHHIVSDGWSLGILARELGSLYEAYRAGKADPLPALPIQYADYAVWQRRWLEGGELQRQGTYWEQALAGAPTLLSLPTDRARPAQQDYAGGSVEVVFDAELSTGLRRLSQRHGTTLFMTVLAGWSVLLSRLSGQDEVVVGSPVANRTRSEVEGLIGFFVNTLALRVEVDGLTVSELLGRVKAKVLEAQAHQDLPFEQIVERVRPVRSLSHSPVFQAALSWLNTEAVGLNLELDGLTIEGVDAGPAAAKFDLTLELRETSEGLAGSLDYATTLFDQATIERYLGYLHRLLKAMAADDSQEVNRIALLDEDERAQLLESWNETEATYPDASTIHGLFEAQVRRTPEAIAVEHEGQQVSYAELNARANRVAHALIGLGVGPDARVGLCAERSVELVVGLLGILKAGGGYIPLDPSYPQDRLAYMLEDSAPVAVLAQSNTREQLGMLSVPVLDLASPLEGEAEHDPQVEGLQPHHLAYVIYTSGSTGQPKGVEATIAGLANRLQWFIRDVLTEAPVTALKTSIGFVDAVTETLGTLLAGGSLIVFDNAAVKDLSVFARRLRQTGVSHLVVVPSLLKYLLQSGETRLDGLRTLVCSGERLAPELARQCLVAYPQVRLLNFYGSSEVNGDATFYRYAGPEHVPTQSVIGRPIANTQIYILDAYGAPVPIGVPGEIHVGGACVARGYLHRPGLTAERFVADPFHGDSRARMYKTGDLGCWQADGNIVYLGRNDHQVKLRGFRIEPGEIEARLAGCEGVREAVVLIRDDGVGEPRLVAYYSGPAALPAQALRAQLQAALPAYMVPAAYVYLERMPLTSSGKLNRHALPQPTAGAYVQHSYEAPRSGIETRLASIWQALLGVETIGRHDDFFALGGNSLQAVRLIGLLAKADCRVTLTQLLQHPNITSLAAVAERDGMRTRDQTVPVRTTGSQRPLFLVHEITGLDGYFTQLGACIDADIPVYGLPAVGWGEPQLRTIEGLAKRLKAAMRVVQPHGPYRLAGWSFGGVLAYEIAIQLIGEDEAVEFLGLLDTRHPALVSGGKPKWAAENRPHHAQLLELCLAYWQQRSPGGPESAQLAGLAGVEDFSALLECCRAQALLAPDLADVTEPDLWHVLDRIVAHGDAQANYTVFPMPLKLHLFVAADEHRDGEPPPHRRWLGWNAILPDTQLQRIVVPGTHQSMVLEHAQVLGEALSAALHAAAGQPQPALQEAHYTPLLTIDAGSHRRESIVCIPGAGDGVVRFMHLAEALGGARPLYGMQPRGVDGWRVPHSTVEAAAAAYVRALDAGQVARGIHLIGHSFGGWVALEMALQLQAAGRAVASLTLLDCEAPGSEAGWLGRTYTATAVLAKFVEAVELALGRSLGIDPAQLHAADEAEQWRLIHAGMVGAGLIPRRSQPGMLRGPIRTFGTALRTPYRPGRLYTGPVRLVLADDPALSREANEREQCRTVSELRGWAPDLVAWRGPGNHFSLLTPPDVQQVAAWWEGLRAEEVAQPVT
ncbi:non-ribosomal peptide synthase/polyketide synthase (plasmid) [Ralstonia pseudosolanacearum]|uniref:non-ribosomal peptide synthase/polyketide synthase n=1 Tax=Ralstonia pseudosolanacearum TaxID=1310165 RepID=UPI00186725B2|nr:non-ribosomal peptide synthase/polyketide synthase [Ralstonia pseudosolanacearum]QOK93783.1 non-ribosomal peptide synthase/polyketide synthase [Ralstonia pseudosolanacearum]